MSRTEGTQSTLDEHQGVDRLRSQKPDWEPNDEDNTDTGVRVNCNNCGNRVTRQFARVFGDNDDQIDNCPECGSQRDRKTGAIEREGMRYE